MLTNKESLDQIIVATPGLKSDAVALGKSTWFLLGLWNVMRWGFSHNARIKSFVSSHVWRVFSQGFCKTRISSFSSPTPACWTCEYWCYLSGP